MYTTIFKHIQKLAYFEKHQKVLIAVSGGVDSMNLLHFLHLYQEKLNIHLGIAHINHKQRPESEEEESYLREWAKLQNIPIYISHFSGVFSEKAARDFRYQFFKKIMAEHHYTALVTAHHADDQAETIFMRLLRGSRLRHLAGIQEVQGFGDGQLIRPFLEIPKRDLPDIFHFEDDSNKSLDYLRNRIRNHYFPELELENPQIKSAMRDLSQESQLVFQALRDLTAKIDKTNCLEFLSQTEAVQDFLLQEYLEQFSDLQISRKQFQELLHIIRTKENFNYKIKGNYHLIKTKTDIQIKKISLETDREKSPKVLEYDNVVEYKQYRFSFQELSTQSNSLLLYSDSPITLRGRQEGDSIDFGTFSKKIRRLFIDEKISLENREKAIIGQQDGEIIFVLVNDKTYLRKAPKDGIMKAKLYIEKLE